MDRRTQCSLLRLPGRIYIGFPRFGSWKNGCAGDIWYYMFLKINVERSNRILDLTTRGSDTCRDKISFCTTRKLPALKDHPLSLQSLSVEPFPMIKRAEREARRWSPLAVMASNVWTSPYIMLSALTWCTSCSLVTANLNSETQALTSHTHPLYGNSFIGTSTYWHSAGSILMASRPGSRRICQPTSRITLQICYVDFTIYR